MTPPAAPDPGATLGQWNAWAAQGRTRAEMDKRLAQVPVQHRDQVASHLRVVVRMRDGH
ncbi:hypothetical protein [uncultured Thiodictyon sp.]|uniref:hypothetical protein n=1 Tax=uncultured Thiodictyon sp. TaxID=1846217 RepID=UPI0025F546DA|nr:hypothetical protein [uncultured Thiodictyon sp.]